MVESDARKFVGRFIPIRNQHHSSERPIRIFRRIYSLVVILYKSVRSADIAVIHIINCCLKQFDDVVNVVFVENAIFFSPIILIDVIIHMGEENELRLLVLDDVADFVKTFCKFLQSLQVVGECFEVLPCERRDAD